MTPVMAVDICWDQYRQRPSQRGEEIAEIYEKEQRAREFFLNWLDSYMNLCGIEDLEIRQAIRKELWLKRGIRWFAMSEKFHNQIRWAKKWLLRLEELIIPVSISSRFWLRDRKD